MIQEKRKYSFNPSSFWSSKIILLIFLFVVLLPFSLAYASENPQQITVSIKYGEQYISSDLNQEGQLIANRASIDIWEKFTLISIKDNQYYIKGSDENYVNINPQTGILLTGQNQKPNAYFIINFIDDSSNCELFSDKGLPIVINENKFLFASKDATASKLFQIKEIPEETHTYFNKTQISFLSAGILLAIVAVILFHFFPQHTKMNWALIFLILSGLLIRVFAILLDNHLNLWDEQFHALVAKNLMNHLLKPTLIDNPILDYPYQM